jgi:hypothetical protein
MSKGSERQAWTRFVEEREREAKRPRVKKQVKEEVLQAELEAGLDDLVTDSDRKGPPTPWRASSAARPHQCERGCRPRRRRRIRVRGSPTSNTRGRHDNSASCG